MKIIKTYKEPTDLLIMNLIKPNNYAGQTIELTDDYIDVEIGEDKYPFETDGFLNIIDLSKIDSNFITDDYNGLFEEFPAVIVKNVKGNVYLDIDIMDEEDGTIKKYTDFNPDDTFILNNLPQDSDYTWDKVELVFDEYDELIEYGDANKLRNAIDDLNDGKQITNQSEREHKGIIVELNQHNDKHEELIDNKEEYKTKTMYELSEETLVEKSDDTDYDKIIDDMFDEHEFYDLMQLYRHTPKYDQRLVTEIFEKLKQYIKDYINK